jgi:hypothetical protein
MWNSLLRQSKALKRKRRLARAIALALLFLLAICMGRVLEASLSP